MTTTPHAAKTFKLIRLFLAGLLLITWAGLPGTLYSAPAASDVVCRSGRQRFKYLHLPCARPASIFKRQSTKRRPATRSSSRPESILEQLSIADKNLTLKGQGAASTFLDGNQADTDSGSLSAAMCRV